MNVYTYTEARRELASLLDKASEEGAVRIQRRNGQSFVLRPEPKEESPFDGVTGVKTDLSGADVVEMVRASRKR
jgi:hypothetical protein